MHNDLINTAKVNSNPLTHKILITNWISIISKNFYDFLVDTNDPLGKYRLRTPKVIDKEKAYSIELEYTWNRQVIRKTTNVFVKVADWN